MPRPSVSSGYDGEFDNRPFKVKINMWLTMFMRQREYEWITHKEGIMDQRMFDAYGGVIALIFGTERNRRWLALRKEINEFDPAFIEYVDAVLARSPLTKYPELVKNWE